MSTISPSSISDGDAVTAASVNNPINTIANDYNGNITNVNIASAAAIATAKLATDAGIQTGMIANSAVDYTKVATGAAIQLVYNETGAVATGSVAIPSDDTIPQITEGTQFMTQAITPKATTSILVIEFTGFFAITTAANNLNVALFQDSTTGALAAVAGRIAATDSQTQITLRHVMVAGTTSATTFRIRAGSGNTNTITFNGSAGARLFGGVGASSLTVTEYKA